MESSIDKTHPGDARQWPGIQKHRPNTSSTLAAATAAASANPSMSNTAKTDADDSDPDDDDQAGDHVAVPPRLAVRMTVIFEPF
jgi:hypothetical protein